MTDEPMYVISESQLKYAGLMHLFPETLKDVYSRPLSDELAKERERVLNEVFSSMDIFFGDIPMDSNIIKWAVSKQDSFVTAAMACYLHSRKLRSESRECPR